MSILTARMIWLEALGTTVPESVVIYEGPETDINWIACGNNDGAIIDNVIIGIQLDGKRLMNPGARDLGDTFLESDVPYELTLECADDTELRFMVGPIQMTRQNGDLITPQTSDVTNVAANTMTEEHFKAIDGSDGVFFLGDYDPNLPISVLRIPAWRSGWRWRKRGWRRWWRWRRPEQGRRNSFASLYRRGADRDRRTES